VRFQRQKGATPWMHIAALKGHGRTPAPAGITRSIASASARNSSRRVAAPSSLEAAEQTVHTILERYLADVPLGPHPNGRHDPFEAILERSAFPRIERIERVYKAPLRPAIESLVGSEYTISHVLTRLEGRREAFEREVRAALGSLDAIGQIWLTLRDEALIGLR